MGSRTRYQVRAMSQAPRRALIVIDVQNEYVSGNLLIEYPPVSESLANIGKAIDAGNAAGIPVVVVQNDAPATSPLFAIGSPGWELHSVVASRRHEHQVNKTLPSAFAGTDLAQWLAQHEIDTLSVVGYMTHNSSRPLTVVWQSSSSRMPPAHCPTPTKRDRPAPRKSIGSSVWCSIAASPPSSVRRSGYRRWRRACPCPALRFRRPASNQQARQQP